MKCVFWISYGYMVSETTNIQVGVCFGCLQVQFHPFHLFQLRNLRMNKYCFWQLKSQIKSAESESKVNFWIFVFWTALEWVVSNQVKKSILLQICLKNCFIDIFRELMIQWEEIWKNIGQLAYICRLLYFFISLTYSSSIGSTCPSPSSKIKTLLFDLGCSYFWFDTAWK